MAKGKYKKKKKDTELIQVKLTELTPDKLNLSNTNTMNGYCFTDKQICQKIDPLTLNCSIFNDPITKCRESISIGCNFSPIKPETKEERIRVGQQKSKKKKRKEKIISRTAGKTKGENCQASPFQKFCTKYARARKHPGYASFMESFIKRK